MIRPCVALLALVLMACRERGSADGNLAAAKPLAGDSAIEARTSVGEQIYMRGEYDSATSIWNEALSSARLVKDTVAEPRILTWLGLAAWRKGDLDKAREL